MATSAQDEDLNLPLVKQLEPLQWDHTGHTHNEGVALAGPICMNIYIEPDYICMHSLACMPAHIHTHMHTRMHMHTDIIYLLHV